MEKLFLNIVNYSLVAGWLILAILLVRLIFKKAPKWIMCILWALVAVRLICPFSIESIFSLVPSSKPLPDDFITTATPFVDTGFTAVDQVINPVVESSLATPDYMLVSANRTQIISFIASIIWIAGVVIMLLYAIVSSLVLKLKLRTATLLEKGIKQSDRIGSPFVFGIFRPYIYLPYSLTGEDLGYVIEHEKAHIKRGDYLWKPLGFVVLSVYWFNPIIWVAYIFLCRDIEAACDEKVVKKLGVEKRREYSTALLNCSIKRRMIAACPIAFGETGVKSRIKNIMNYKKPAFWILLVSLVACIVVAVCFLTNPEKTPWQYPVDMNSDAWKNMSLEEKYEACRIPEDELDKMSDEELVQAVNDYPFLLDLLAVDSTSNNEWANIFASRCDAFENLRSREKGAVTLSAFIEEKYNGDASGEAKLKRDSLKLLLAYLQRISPPMVEADTYLISDYNIFNNVFKSLEDYSDDKKVEEYLNSLHGLSMVELSSYGIWMDFAITDEERLNIWNDFAKRVNAGEPAAIVFGRRGEEFSPMLHYCSFNGNEFYYRYDNTCDLWCEVHEIHPSETYKYLVNAVHGSIVYLLTNKEDLNYEEFRYDLFENTYTDGVEFAKKYETIFLGYENYSKSEKEIIAGRCIYDWNQMGSLTTDKIEEDKKLIQEYKTALNNKDFDAYRSLFNSELCKEMQKYVVDYDGTAVFWGPDNIEIMTVEKVTVGSYGFAANKYRNISCYKVSSNKKYSNNSTSTIGKDGVEYDIFIIGDEDDQRKICGILNTTADIGNLDGNAEEDYLVYSSVEKILQSFGGVIDIIKTYKLDNWYNKAVKYYISQDEILDFDINYTQYRKLLEMVINVNLIGEKCSQCLVDYKEKLTDYVVIEATDELSMAGIILNQIAIGEKNIYVSVYEKDGKVNTYYIPFKTGTRINMANVRGTLFTKENFDEYAKNMSASSYKNIFETGTYQNNTGYFVDLDGDGEKEALLVAKANENGGHTGEIIYINGECVVYQGYDDGVLPDRFSVIDVDKSDGQMEILIDCDMSAYSGSRLYSYRDGKLNLLGELSFSLMKIVGEDFYNRIEDMDRIPGDGTLFGYANMGYVLQDNLYADITLKLNPEHTGFEVMDELFYPWKYNEKQGLADDHYYKLRYNVCLASDMDPSTIDKNNVIEKGDVIIDITDGRRWIHVKAVEGNTAGGWIDMDALLDYILEEADPALLLQSSSRGDVLFENLNHAG